MLFAASARMPPMFCSDCAAEPGWVTTKKISNAMASRPTIFLTFTLTTVLERCREAFLLDFLQHGRDPWYPARGQYGRES